MKSDADAIQRLHGEILAAWNRQDGDAYAQCFTETAIVLGFDGSEMQGRGEIARQLRSIFADHQVAAYVRIVRGVRILGEDAALLHAVVGMVPPGGADVRPDRSAVQLLLAVRADVAWRAQAFQNTPAMFDGRPEAAPALTGELRAALARR